LKFFLETQGRAGATKFVRIRAIRVFFRGRLRVQKTEKFCAALQKDRSAAQLRELSRGPEGQEFRAEIAGGEEDLPACRGKF
jgi:hypothetical protein